VESLDSLADEVANIETKVADVIFETVREQLRGSAEEARNLERRLSKVRRSLQKAESLLRHADVDD
jgi:hypothetical protein